MMSTTVGSGNAVSYRAMSIAVRVGDVTNDSFTFTTSAASSFKSQTTKCLLGIVARRAFVRDVTVQREGIRSKASQIQAALVRAKIVSRGQWVRANEIRDIASSGVSVSHTVA